MKPKKRHQSSSEDSEESEDHQSSSSDTESEESSASEHRYKKKKKRDRAGSSDSDSDSADGQRRAKKRKHKKKKKKHVKRKRRSESVGNSESEAQEFSMSDGEVSPKKKHKKHHKYKRSHSSSASEKEEEHKERRLHSVVKERRSSEDGERPPTSYYQYHRPASPAENYVDDREREVMRFYRGSSKERRYHEQYPYVQERNNGRMNQGYTTQRAPYIPSGDQNRKKTDQITDQNRGPKDHQRNPRYEGNHKNPGEYPRRQPFQPREDTRGFKSNFNQYEDRKRREFEENRDFRDRRGPPEPDRYREREFPERRDRYRDEPFLADRSREVRRDKPMPPSRPDRPPPPPPPHHSVEDRYRERSKPHPERNDRPDRFRDGRDERGPPEPRRPQHSPIRRPTDIRRVSPPRRPADHRRVSPDRRPTDNRRVSPDRRPTDGRRPSLDRHPSDGRDGRRSSPDRRPSDGRDGRRLSPDRRPSDGRDGRRSSPDRRPTDGRRSSPDRRPDRSRSEVKTDPRSKERKSRFGDAADNKEYDWGKEGDKKDGKPAVDKEKPNFGLSGKLTADANTVNGVVIKYTEPEDAKQPKRKWRFYPFKGDKVLPILYIHRQSAFLIGRDKKVCDITLDHPSISKQHAALQYRATPFTRDDGTQGRRVRPYVIDLESANGTFVNNKKIEPRRYVELLERDIVKFGFSERDYVLLHENSKDEAQDDDNEATIGAAVTTTAQIKAEKRIKTEITEDGE